MFDIASIMSKLDELAVAFVNMPIEYQIAVGLGGLVVLGALRNVWGILKPARWATANALRSIAWVISPRKSRASGVMPRVKKSRNKDYNFDVSTEEAYRQTCKRFANKNNVKQLSDQQLKILQAAGKGYFGNNLMPFEKPWVLEQKNRKRQQEVRSQVNAVMVTSDGIASELCPSAEPEIAYKQF